MSGRFLRVAACQAGIKERLQLLRSGKWRAIPRALRFRGHYLARAFYVWW